MSTALVTGGAAGIGHAIVQRLSRDGFGVIVADLDGERAASVAAALRAGGAVAASVEVDVADEASVAAMAAQVPTLCDGLDVLVNNAGITGPHLSFADYPIATMRKVLEIDLVGTLLVTQALLPLMLGTGRGGRIVNLASIAGKDGNPKLAPYAAAKGGIIAFTKSLGRELADTGILVNAIAPGGVGGTEIFKSAGGDATQPQQGARVAASTPMGRLAVPEEVAALASWLCSSECSYSTGSIYDISGGRATY